MNFFQKTIFLALLLCGSTLLLPQSSVYAQKTKTLQWSIVSMDSTWNPQGTSVTGKIIGKYKPTIDPLMETIGHTSKELRKDPPESPLSNLSADIIFQYGQKYLDARAGGNKIDMALTNFGGIRTVLPAGKITTFDILSVFPFDNRIVILELPGKYMRELMENFAKRGRVEALSGVEVEIEDHQLKKCRIGGRELDDNAVYRIATIDFLLGGGESMYALKYATQVTETGTILRDAVIEYVKARTALGEMIDAQKDGRVIIKNNK